MVKPLRLWVAALIVWLFLFFNVERIHEPINIASFVYPFAAAAAILVVTARRLSRRSLAWIQVGLVAAFFGLKVGLGYGLLGPDLPVTITELFAIGVTVALATQIARTLAEVDRGAVELMSLNANHRASTFEVGQVDVYREVRRARKFKRPLTLVAVSPTGTSLEASVDRMMQSVQRETIARYAEALLAELLSDETHDCDIITACDDYFLMLLPETDRERADRVVKRVSAAADERLGLDLVSGVVTFPAEEVTLAGLLERAEHRMRQQLESPEDVDQEDPQTAEQAVARRRFGAS